MMMLTDDVLSLHFHVIFFVRVKHLVRVIDTSDSYTRSLREINA